MVTPTKTLKFDDDVLEVLQQMTVTQDGPQFKGQLSGQLDRSLYTRTMKAIEVLGGSWNKSAKCHLFSDDPRLQLAGVLDTGAITVAKESWFPTPSDIVEEMIGWADIYPHNTVLEPSAGEGAIADGLANHGITNIRCVEMNPKRAQTLRSKGYIVYEMDFMAYRTQKYFDRVCMNPPFEAGQDMDHVQKAFSHLVHGGVLVSVMSPGPFFREDAKSKAFRNWFAVAGGNEIDLPEGSFKESGTGVRSKLVRIEK